MNPLPQKVLVPTTSHRIPLTANAEGVVRKLLAFDLNASAFFMEAEQLDTLESDGFVNDFDRAFEDFFYQIPTDVRKKVFPAPPETSVEEKTSPSDSGMVSNRPKTAPARIHSAGA